MTWLEMTAWMMYSTFGLPVTSTNWWTLAVITLLINLSPFCLMPHFYSQMWDLCEKKESVDNEFVKVKKNEEEDSKEEKSID